jgi:hypothetical protein
MVLALVLVFDRLGLGLRLAADVAAEDKDRIRMPNADLSCTGDRQVNGEERSLLVTATMVRV